ncbi:hypothetical protein D3C78_992640 [compost metagenome]
MLGGQRHDRVHVARPAGQMHADHRTGTRRQYRADGLGGDVLRVAIHLGEHRHRTDIDDAGNRSEEGARRHHHLVAGTDAQRLQRHIQRHRAVGQGDGVLGAGPGGEFLFELTTLLPGPVVDLVGQNHIANGIGLFLGEGGPGGERCIQHDQYPSITSGNIQPARASCRSGAVIVMRTHARSTNI